ncbi:facilitated trehalose transporter Tret1-like [Ostrinia nubilalis]|uniref:facilitated trehalose transporter Tret1-like n=1 Tax=Ostrinia nubilalis TaxID=29057 RepID=UPI0030824859
MVNQSTFKNVMPKVSSPLLKQMLVAMSCNMFCLITGCTFGFTAVLLPQIKKDDEFPYSDTYDSWIASSSCLAMAVGCFAGGLLSDRYGRRITHLIVAMPFLAGWIVLAFAKNVLALLIGRVLTGLSSGVFRSLGAIYLGEIFLPVTVHYKGAYTLMDIRFPKYSLTERQSTSDDYNLL